MPKCNRRSCYWSLECFSKKVSVGSCELSRIVREKVEKSMDLVFVAHVAENYCSALGIGQASEEMMWHSFWTL